KWMNDLPEQYKPAQNWLRYLHKEEEAVKKASKRNEDIIKVQKEIGEYKKDYETEAVKSESAIRNILTKIDPSVSDLKSTTLMRQILKADKLENPEFKLVDSEPKNVRNAKLSALIKSELPNVSDEALAENIDAIAGFREMSVKANSSLNKLKQHSTPQAIFSYNKNLFMVAAHHRRSVQAELNIPERLAAYEKVLNIPVRESLVEKSAEKADSKTIMEYEVQLPAQLDNILSKMQMGDRTSVVMSFLDDASEKIKSGNEETLQTYAENAHIKPNASQVLKKIDTVKASLLDNPSNKQIAEAVNLLGYSSQVEMVADMYKTFADNVDENMIASDKVANIGKEIKSVANEYSKTEEKLGLPSRQEVVLNVLEATGEVVPEKTLQEMQAKFDKVAVAQAENDDRIVEPGVKKPKVPDSMYKFSPEEKQVYAQIESKLPAMKEYAKVNAKEMNKALDEQLDALYAEAGRLDGHLWVGGEGESGLYDNQSIKVLEMITGKHYYNETDIDKVVEHIKRGEGSGTSSTNVDSDAYSGHAQYVAEVSQVAVIDPQTKETVMKDVLWHDNTWGRAEDKSVWTDEKGVERTNYGKVNRGGPEGYVFSKKLFTGTFVEDQKYTPGVLKDPKSAGQKFDLWRATRIAGENPEAQQNIENAMNSILELGSGERKLQEYEKFFKQATLVDFKSMDNIDSEVSKISNSLISKIEKVNVQKQEDLDGIKDSQLKFLLEKTAVQMSVSSQSVKNYISNVLDKESLEDLKTKLPDVQKQMIASTFLKGKDAPKTIIESAQQDILNVFNSVYTKETAPDNLQQVLKGIVNVPVDKLDGSISNLKQVMIDNAKEKISEGIKDKNTAQQLIDNLSEVFTSAVDNQMIRSSDDLKENSDIADVIIKYVDKKFNTSSDSDLNSALSKLQNMTNDEFNAFMADATNEDLGIKNVNSLDVARQINAQKAVATDAFSKNARIQVLLTEGPSDDKAPEWIYRKLKQDISPLNNTIQIEKYKKEGMMERQGIRSAFPKAEIMSDEEIKDNVVETLQIVKDSVSDINSAENKSEAADELNAKIQGYIDANIAEKYQSKAAGLINSYVKALKNNSTDADKIMNDAVSVMEQGHIVKHPTELLKSFIKEVQSKNPDNEKLAQLREYMIQAINVSDIANVEYTLIDNASNAYETMTKDSFKNYPLSTADGKQIELDSDEGVMFLVDKLANPTNGSTALQVFFAHTGLSERAVNLISSSINLDEIPEECEKLGNHIKETYSGINRLNDAFEEFAKENSVSYSSYKDAVSHLVKVMDKKYSDVKSEQEQNVYNQYKQIIVKTANSDFAKKAGSEQVMQLLSKVHDASINSVKRLSASEAAALNDVSVTLYNRTSAMEALKVDPKSEAEQVRQQFVKNAEETYSKLTEIINNVNKSVA
ncbi:MAG: hypothetical protein ACI37T_07585, partial [Candidatus Gastranaerophilaceae bacterium]